MARMLPEGAVVEVPSRVDARGAHPTPAGPLPEATAALPPVPAEERSGVPEGIARITRPPSPQP